MILIFKIKLKKNKKANEEEVTKVFNSGINNLRFSPSSIKKVLPASSNVLGDLNSMWETIEILEESKGNRK